MHHLPGMQKTYGDSLVRGMNDVESGADVVIDDRSRRFEYYGHHQVVRGLGVRPTEGGVLIASGGWDRQVHFNSVETGAH